METWTAYLSLCMCRLCGEFEGHAYRANINYQWEALEQAT